MKSPLTFNQSLLSNLSIPVFFLFSIFLETDIITTNPSLEKVVVVSEYDTPPIISSSFTAISNPVVDSLALVALYNSTDGPNWTNTWDLSQPIATWYGVTLDGTGCVTNLSLQSNQLNGTIPVELGNLTNLSLLSLDGNQLSGSIPIELGNLINLINLGLDGNQLNGSIPPTLGNLINLQYLGLGDNQLNGSIPPELGNLINLNSLQLSLNSLSGIIPIELGNLTSSIEVYLNENQLSGAIPTALGNLTNLITINLGNNQFTGSIPAAFGNLTNLTLLNFSNNQLSGTIPIELGNLTNLSLLLLDGNQLTGSIPIELGNLSNLIHLNLASNQLTGSIPFELGNLPNLTNLELNANQLSGSIPTTLGNLTNLTLLNLFDNQLTGNIPVELGNLNNITTLSLFANQLTGNIPSELGNLDNLTSLQLGINQLTGSIPASLGNLTSLMNLALDNNQLSGCYPTSLFNLCSVPIINFSNNPMLPWQGDFSMFCATGGTEAEQYGSFCDDGDPNTNNDVITPSCTCAGSACTLICNSGVTTFPAFISITAADLLVSSIDCIGTLTIDIPATGGNGIEVFLDCALYQPNQIYTAFITDSDSGSSCSTDFMIFDDEAPGITCPPDVTLSSDLGSCTATLSAASMVPTNAMDNCVVFTISYLLTGATSGSGDIADVPLTYPVGVTTVTYIITDNSANTSSCSFNVIISDDELPEVSNCPALPIFSNDPGQAGATVSWTLPGFSDNCGIAGVFSTHLPGDFFPIGFTTVIYTGSDDSGNVTNCSFNVIVNDTELPSISCPSDITLAAAPGDTGANVSFPPPTGMDNSGFVTVSGTNASGDFFPIGLTTVFYIATDGSGNSATCSFNVTVIDSELPSISCPSDITLAAAPGDTGANVSFPPPTGMDNSGFVTVSGTHASGDFFPIGSTTVTYTATDGSGNSSSCSFTITVTGMLNCPVILPDDVTLCPAAGMSIDAGAGYDTYVWSPGGSTDQIIVVPGMASGTETYTVTVTCSNGSTGTDFINITWEDNEAPVLTCEDVTLELDANCEAFLSVADLNGTFVDNCSASAELILSAQLNNSDPFQDTGVFIVELLVTDASGNTATCESIVTVENNSSFFGQCYTNLTYELDETGNYSLDPADLLQAISANCSVNLTVSPSILTCQDIGLNPVTLTASNNTGNSFSCTSNITILDNMPPALTYCPPDTTVLVFASDLPYPIDAGLTPVFTDNCNFTVTTPGITTLPFGATSITFVATDDVGNFSSCSFQVTIDTFQVGNDSQDGSITIIPSESCSSFDGNVAFASPSFPQPTGCSQGGGTRKDVWYYFVAPTEPVTIKVAGSPQFQAGMDVYDANQNYITCKAAPEEGAVDSLVLTPGLTPGMIAGEPYYVRVYDVEGNPGTTYFTIYIYVNACPIPILIPQQGFHQANSEFTDEDGWTHYIENDTFLLFSINREGRNIGHVNDNLFTVELNRDASVYDVSDAPYALAGVNYGASGYYWKVTPNYDASLSPGQEFSIRSYYTSAEYQAMLDSFPQLGIEGHELLTHYKIDGSLNPSAAPPASHAAINPSSIHFFDSGTPPGGYTFAPFVSSATSSDYVIEMCIIDFSGGGFMYRNALVGTKTPLPGWTAISLFPVPTYNDLNLLFTTQNAGKGQLEIYDLMGRQMDQMPLDYHIGENRKVVTIPHLATGVYFLKLIDKDGLYTTLRFVKTEK